MTPIVLSKRMQQAVDFVPEGCSLADIGTDHGFIPIYAVQTGRSPHAIATDLREGPLANARAHVANFGLSNRIELRLGDGLKPIRVGEIDVILTAGIGGHVHAEMIRSSRDVAASVKKLIFQPMNASHVLRQTLHEMSFHIEAEALLTDEDRLYEIIVAKPDRVPDGAYASYARDTPSRQLAYTYGPHLLAERSDLLLMKMQRDIASKQAIQSAINMSSQASKEERIELLEQEIRTLTQWLEGGGIS